MIDLVKGIEATEIKRQYIGVMTKKENKALEQKVIEFLSDYDDENYARTLDDVFAQQDKEIKKYL